MSAASSSRDIVEDYLRYKLLINGLAWRVPPERRRTAAERRHNAGASTPTSSSRAERAMTSHRGNTLQDPHQGPPSTPPQLQVVLRCACDKLERRYHGDLAAHVSALLSHNGGVAERRQGLTAVREELFRDGVNWGRIVALMELGGALCTEVVRTGGAWQVNDIAAWMEESLDSAPLHTWIHDHGGWDAFVELYSESRPPVGFWSLRRVFGLAVLGAAGITLGALFTQR
ncbi:Apoptosis regulator Bcl-2 [Nibea albiflora]|uniref:Apoptosis regulator Bcl-2 n=1 Tax=Nibea albiflora TaxID=240163 RepID=A0ACB7F6B6_NIBAL|nr:Apoptosis regulator Bcl-2 [Nibea albiflora]